MTFSLLIVIIFIFINVIIGTLVSPKKIINKEQFTLAGRSLGGLLLFSTMAATNFSAFTIFGLSGAGYRIGWAYYPAMAFGTGFMALSFILLGIPMYRLSRAHGWISPSQFIEARYKSTGLSKLYTFVLVIITIPYIAIQARSGGLLIQSISGFSYPVSTAIVVFLVMLYVFRGGMKSVVYTDLLQLITLVVISGLAFAIIALGAKKIDIDLHNPLLQNRSGANDNFPISAYLSTMALWFLADPMFPQLFQRFFSARNEKALVKTAMFYPVITAILFFMTIGAGVFGAVIIPGLSVSESDQIFIKAAGKIGGSWLTTLLSLAGLAALLSTMDSQLLSIATISTETFFPKRFKTVTAEKIMVILIAVFGYLGALYPVKSILDFLTSTAFPAYAIMAPLFWGGLYFNIGKKSAFMALISGIMLVLAEFWGWKPQPFPAVIFNLFFQIAVLIAGKLLFDRQRTRSDFVIPLDTILSRKQIFLFSLIFVLAIDIWNYNRITHLLFGIPGFIFYSFGLCLVLSLIIWIQYKYVSD